MRKVTEFRSSDNRLTKVYYNADFKEYTVKFYSSDGTYMDASDYFTNDKDDALATAQLHVKEERA
jgi:hypothetical protein